MRMQALWIALALVVLGGARPAAAGKKTPRGYWCFSATLSGGKSSTCARAQEDCQRGVDGMSKIGASASRCAWQASAWSARINGEVWLFATKEDCDQQRENMGGTKCKSVK